MNKEQMTLSSISGLSEGEAQQLLESIFWPKGAICPRCEGRNVVRLEGKSTRPGLRRCKTCRRDKRPDQFTVTVGTIFESSHIPLRKWVMAFHIMCSSKKGVSALQLKRTLGIAYHSAWHMAHRIRWAMREEPFAGMLKGIVEVDEAYIGGKAKGGKVGRGAPKKTAIVVLIERNGRARSRPVDNVSAKELKGAIRENVDTSSTIMTDEWPSYRGIGEEFDGGHKVVCHARKEYVRGDAYTNTAESYFALLKRGIHGSFHHVSKQHLFRYCDEFSFRWNYRNVSDGERTMAALRQAPGKRLRYKYPVGPGPLRTL